VEFNLRIPTKLVWHFSKFSTIFYKFLKFIAFELGGALEFYRDTLNTFEIFAHIPLARRGRKAEVVPAKFRRGDGRGWRKGWSASTRRSRRTFLRSWEGEGMTGGGFLTVAEAAAEGRSSVRRFPTEGEAWAQ
jgi:hypothetical protein